MKREEYLDRIRALLPEEKSAAFQSRVFDLSGGRVEAAVTGESFRAVPVRKSEK